MRLNRNWTKSCLAAFVAVQTALCSENIPIPNGSFEQPSVRFVSILVNSWQKTPKPDWYVESGGYSWNQLAGVFLNTPDGSSDHLDNCDGFQAIYLFAIPSAGLFQDYDSTDSLSTIPSHAFDAVYEAGKAYDLTVAVNGGGGNMLEGATLELALYYRDGSSDQVAVATTTATNSIAAFPVHTHLTDYTVHLPFVQATDAWAGKHVGVRLKSTVNLDQQGGYWDLDNVRLSATPEPSFAVTATPTETGLQLSWPSTHGFQYQIESTENLKAWTSYGAALAGTGDKLVSTVPRIATVEKYFRVRATPSL